MLFQLRSARLICLRSASRPGSSDGRWQLRIQMRSSSAMPARKSHSVGPCLSVGTQRTYYSTAGVQHNCCKHWQLSTETRCFQGISVQQHGGLGVDHTSTSEFKHATR